MSPYFSRVRSRVVPDGVGIGDLLAAGDGDERSIGQVRAGLAVLPCAPEVAGVDGGGGEPAGVRGVRAVARAPEVAGLDTVGVGGEVAHLLEGVAAVAEVLRPVGEKLELPRLHLGAVLCALEVAHLGHDAVDGPVEALGLGVEHVHEAPHQGLALVGHLSALDGDAVHDDADGFAERLDGVVLVPDDPAVAFAALRCSTEEGEVVADGSGG